MSAFEEWAGSGRTDGPPPDPAANAQPLDPSRLVDPTAMRHLTREAAAELVQDMATYRGRMRVRAALIDAQHDDLACPGCWAQVREVFDGPVPGAGVN